MQTDITDIDLVCSAFKLYFSAGCTVVSKYTDNNSIYLLYNYITIYCVGSDNEIRGH